MPKEHIYLVGGAVRDSLLGLSITERDWVVVGGSAQSLIDRGFKQIGKDFPVFLHPETKEEYALARTEQKSGLGHKGFNLNFPKSISIEEDLKRRDFTINAMAQDLDGNIIDPWGGQKDLKLRIIRHVSEAFSEDPLRVLRAARFSARFSKLGFSIAPETLELMRDMISENEISHISGERIWREIESALKTNSPEIFFEVLYICEALKAIFPEIEHIHLEQLKLSLNTLKRSTEISLDSRVRFAAFFYLLTNNLRNVEDIQGRIFFRIKPPNKYKNLINSVQVLAPKYLKIMELNKFELALLLKELDSLRKNNELELTALACEAIFHQSVGKNKLSIKFQYLMEAKAIFSKSTIDIKPQTQLNGKDYGNALFNAKVEELNIWMNSGTKKPEISS